MRMDEKDLGRAVAMDAVAVLEEVLESEDMDLDACNALDGFALCGSRWCEACGCLTDKLARARQLGNRPNAVQLPPAPTEAL